MKKEALWTIANIMHGYKTQPCGHSATRCQTLVMYGCIPAMTAMLDVNDTAVQKLVRFYTLYFRWTDDAGCVLCTHHRCIVYTFYAFALLLFIRRTSPVAKGVASGLLD